MNGGGERGHEALVAARASYGRLIAYLAARSGDVAAAEDALGDAFRVAVETWPARGVPDRPEAWLLASARRRLIDSARHRQVRAQAADTLHLLTEEAAMRAEASLDFPDERLKLLFICAHPAIDPAARTPLMLQVVLGLDAARIASAFLVSPTAMGQRLVRAKAKIRDARIAFQVPGKADLPERLDAVLDAVYAAYTAGWDDAAGLGPGTGKEGLAEEALFLAGLVSDLLPGEPEALGLLALLLFCEARRPARRSPEGAFVPLSDQDVSLWSLPMIDQARASLAGAAAARQLGRFQLEAAIQVLHAARLEGTEPNWQTIASLYETLLDIAPTIGARTGRAAALAEARGPEAGLAALSDIEPGKIADYQPYWVLRADLLTRMGRPAEAQGALTRAMALTDDAAVRTFLNSKQPVHPPDGAVPAGHS